MKNTIRSRMVTIALAATMAVSMVPAMSVSASTLDTVDAQTSVTAEVSQQYVMQPGDVFVTDCAIARGIVGHAAIAISNDEILHIGGYGHKPSVMSLAEWNEQYSSEPGTCTRVYRLSDTAMANAAANWAAKTYVGSDAEYWIPIPLLQEDDSASTRQTYCSKLVWQAFYYGAYRHPSEDKHDGLIRPYDLEREIPDLHFVHVFAKEDSAKKESNTSCSETVNGFIPMTFKTEGVSGRVKSNTLRYEYICRVKADSAEAIAAKRDNPASVSTPDNDGMVSILVKGSKKVMTDTTLNFAIPTSADIRTLKLTVGYDGVSAVQNHDNFCEYNFNSYVGAPVTAIDVKCISKTNILGGSFGVFGYDVRAQITVNGIRVEDKLDK